VRCRPADSQKIKKTFGESRALYHLNEPTAEWLSYFQLILDLIAGATRRHTFSKWELDLMLDLEVSRLRKSSRPEVLRRYLRFLQLDNTRGGQEPVRFSAFMTNENQHGRAAKSGQ
jgi:hypothetical protein